LVQDWLQLGLALARIGFSDASARQARFHNAKKRAGALERLKRFTRWAELKKA